MKTKGNDEKLLRAVGAPLMGALGNHKGCPYKDGGGRGGPAGAGWPPAGNPSADGLPLQNRGNKARMSMKTKGNDEKLLRTVGADRNARAAGREAAGSSTCGTPTNRLEN